jgi:hypothetical protein
VAASTTSGVVPKVFWTRIRSASPPWLRCVIIRTDWLSSAVGARRCCDWAHEVNHGRGPAFAPAAEDAAAVPAAIVAATVNAVASLRTMSRFTADPPVRRRSFDLECRRVSTA